VRPRSLSACRSLLLAALLTLLVPTIAHARVTRLDARPSVTSFAADASAGGTLRAGTTVKGVNAVIPEFKVAFVYPPQRHGRSAAQVVKVLIRPATPGATPIGGCVGCTGKGRFTEATRRGNVLVSRVKGRLGFGRRTRLVIGYIRGDGIGRFRSYGVSLHPPHLVLVKQGCLAAGTISLGNGKTSTSLLSDLLNPKSLPQVPCSSHVPGADAGEISAPWEQSTSTPQTGQVTGKVSGRRWLTIFQSHRRCAANPLEESSSGFSPQVFAVHGSFHQNFSTGTDTRRGYFCAYLQIGGRFHNVPTGRVTAAAQRPYYGGDSFTLSAPPQVLGGQVLASTVTGVAAVTEQVWVFASNSACAPTAQAEAAHKFASTTKVVKGTYSVSFSVGTLSQSANVCAYVQSQRSKTKPAGQTLFATGSSVALAVGSLTLSGSLVVSYGATLSTVVSGTASVPATVWSFTSFNTCLATAAAEYTQKYGWTTIAVSGAYTYTLTSPQILHAPGPLYRCDYLQAGTSLDGAVLASASQEITEEWVLPTVESTAFNGDQAQYLITGNAAVAENLWVFTTQGACQATATEEAGQEPLSNKYNVVPGTINLFPVNSQALSPGQWNVCVYLESGPLGPLPSGSPVVSNKASFTLS
jgi:hypothetical protein